ncbi:MAG: hypothetical protein AAGJ81_00785 [Verrucomicrobiota bacterium]
MTQHETPDPSILAGGSQVSSRDSNQGFTFKEFVRFVRLFPWTLLLIAVAVIVEFLPDSLKGTTLDYSMVVFALVVFVVEVLKGADIKLTRFVIDLVVAVCAVVIATALLTYEISRTGESPQFYQWVVAAVVVLDAIIGTTIAFSTALRNMAVAHDL